MNNDEEIKDLERMWTENTRWQGLTRSYTAQDVLSLRTSITIDYTLARLGAERLWRSLNDESYIAALGAMTGAQAVQMVKAGIKSIYVSGWQVAADANLSFQTYPDQSLYPSNSTPTLVRRINNALMRADQIARSEGRDSIGNWYVPLVADAEAGFGGCLHAYELMRAMIEAGAAGVHFEDQLSAEKKCGHLGGKVLIPTSHFVKTLIAARLATDVMGVPTILIARTDARSAALLTSDIDEADRQFIWGERTVEGFYRIKDGLEPAIARSLTYAPYADLLWFETSQPDLDEAARFADAIHQKFPGKLLAYNCSPSFNWRKNLSNEQIAQFNIELARLGYKYQFITLAGWHSINLNAFELSAEFCEEGMPAYVRLQDEESQWEKRGYTARLHQHEVGTGYFDRVLMTITRGYASTASLGTSTEATQFS